MGRFKMPGFSGFHGTPLNRNTEPEEEKDTKEVKKHPSTKEVPSEWDQFKMNPNAYISGAPSRVANWFKGK